MKPASFLERFRFSYTNALLQEAVRSLHRRFRGRLNLQVAAVTPAVKLNRSKMIRIV